VWSNANVPSGLTSTKVVASRRACPPRSVVDGVISEASAAKGGIVSAALLDQIATINEQVRRAEKSTRHKVLRAAVSFSGANKGLIAAALVATVLGVAGNVLGCGATILAGIGAKYLPSGWKLPPSDSFEELEGAIHRTMEPAVQRVLSAYLATPIRAVQVWRVREELQAAKKGSG
jgi:hypothetical protein